MENKKGFRADDLNRGESPDKTKNRKPNQTDDDDMNINRDKSKRQDRGKQHDKEDMENE
jgi:hypothetical protein